jgi:hypothetical protein
MKLQEPGKYEGAEVMRASQTLSACADSDMLATINKDASELIGIEEQRNPVKEAYRLAMHNNFTRQKAYKRLGSMAAKAGARAARGGRARAFSVCGPLRSYSNGEVYGEPYARLCNKVLSSARQVRGLRGMAERERVLHAPACEARARDEPADAALSAVEEGMSILRLGAPPPLPPPPPAIGMPLPRVRRQVADYILGPWNSAASPICTKVLIEIF